MSDELTNNPFENGAAFNQFLMVAYNDLHQIAQRLFSTERDNHTLQPTALVHEAYLKLISRGSNTYWKNSGQFYAFAAGVMRQILVDHARKKNAVKRGGTEVIVPLIDEADVNSMFNLDILDLDQALLELAEKDPRKAELVELKFFGGLTNAEIAEQLGLSVKSIERDWRLSRAFLYSRVRKK